MRYLLDTNTIIFALRRVQPRSRPPRGRLVGVRQAGGRPRRRRGKWDVVDKSGDEIGGLEYLEVALGGVVGLGTVDYGLCFGLPGDFLEGKRGATAGRS